MTQREGSKALAGAFSFNDMDVTTRAFVIDTDVTTTAGDLSLTATRSGDLITLAAGIAACSGERQHQRRRLSPLNMILNDTRAYLGRVVGDDFGNVTVNASDNSRIIAIGGGVAVGGKAGVGAGVGANLLGTDDRCSDRSTSAPRSRTRHSTIGGYQARRDRDEREPVPRPPHLRDRRGHRGRAGPKQRSASAPTSRSTSRSTTPRRTSRAAP